MTKEVNIPINQLSLEEIEKLLFQSEQAARNYIQSKIPQKELKTFDILIEYDSDESRIEGIIDIQLIKRSKTDPTSVADGAVKLIFEIVEKRLKALPSEE
ncbi:MAG: DUF3194 domain-containing protein [Candidatus Helarchaeota archaeon]